MKIQSATPIKYNQNTYKKNNRQQASFGMNPSKALKATNEVLTDGLAYGFGWLGTTKPVQKLVDFMKETNYQRHISAFVGVVLSSFYMIDTARSKRIEKDQKMPLIVNQGTVSVLSTAGAYTLDRWLDKKFANIVDTINIANISDKKSQDAMVKYHADKGNYDVMENTVKVLKTKDQMVAKDLLEALDNPEKLNQLKENLKDNNTAKNLFIEMEKSQNPKELLKQNFENTEMFSKTLLERFQLKGKDIKALNEMVKEGKADETVKTLVNSINGIAKTEKNKLGTATDMFKANMKNSPILKKMFAKASFQNSIDILAESDSKLSKRMKGFKFAKSMMVFAMIYRFIAPVFATPIANTISDKVEANRKAKKTAVKSAA